jgi:signal transduction histidine kinase
VQVGWWIFDQHTYTAERVQAARTAYAEQTAAAQALLDSGATAARVRQLLPAIDVNGGHATLAAPVAQMLLTEEQRRNRQYAWEGGFFLLALATCIFVIARALRAEAHVFAEQDSFLALVSHQFKTPLASLQLSLETLALRTLPPERTRVLLERMLADVARMELMVTQILESARLERGRADFRPETLQLAGAVARVVAQLEERARQTHVRISTHIDAQLHVVSDPLALDVVVRNLLENALVALAPAQGGTIDLAASAVGGSVELVVRDSGVGFAAADAAHLFERFSRPHTGAGNSGTGLGLFIVRKLMQLAGGSARAHSDGPGKGASFVLSWPAGAGPQPGT